MPQSLSQTFPYFAFILGLCVGSFCNVAIYRLPTGGSVLFPTRSFCPHCKEFLAAHFNIPLVSYILLRGKCRYCKAPISPRYPLVELVVGIIFLAMYNSFGFPYFFIYATWLTSLVVITAIDLEHQIIPDVISLPWILIGLVLSFFSLIPVSFISSFVGALLGGVIFFLVAYLSKGGMGGGDIKMIAMMGSFLGWQKMLLVIFSSSLMGSLLGIILMVLGKKGRKSEIPYGPFLALGGILSLFWGDQLLELYLRLTFYG